MNKCHYFADVMFIIKPIMWPWERKIAKENIQMQPLWRCRRKSFRRCLFLIVVISCSPTATFISDVKSSFWQKNSTCAPKLRSIFQYFQLEIKWKWSFYSELNCQQRVLHKDIEYLVLLSSHHQKRQQPLILSRNLNPSDYSSLRNDWVVIGDQPIDN